MHVAIFREGVQQTRIRRQMRHDAQLDLRIIGGYQRVARCGDEGLADAPPLVRADRNVLQIGIGRRQSAGRRDTLMIAGVDASRVLVDLLGQLVRVGRLEFGDAAIFENQFGQRIRCRQFLEHVFRGRRLSGRRLAHHRQAELAEQDLLQLLGRIHVERAARFGVSLRLQLQHARREFRALRLQKSPIHQHAGALHAIQHRHQRLLDGLVEVLQARQRFDLRP